METSSIYQYVQGQEASFRLPIRLNESWTWSFVEHVQLSMLYKHSQLKNGKDEFTPVKNITRPILNLQYRAEGFDVKDIVLYVNDSKNYYKSFLVKKFHEKWARENNIDTFIDEMVESYVDFGGALIKHVNGAKPEVVNLANVAFCDQTDMLSGPLGIKHFYSPDQLMAMAKVGWGETSNGANASLKDAIRLSREEKKDAQTKDTAQTTGKYIEVYEVHGQFPLSYLDPKKSPDEYENQLHIICFYQNQGKKEGLTLFKGREKELPFKLVKRDPINGRALGFGGAEELFEPQVWVNYDMIRMQDMLDAASKTILITSDPTVSQKNKVRDMDNLSIISEMNGGNTRQLDTFPRNLALFEKSVSEWENHAQQMGAANDTIMGDQPASGTPFKLQELVTNEAHSLHEYRKGKLATFLDEVYRDWIIPDMTREMMAGAEFLSELSQDELEAVTDAVVTNRANDLIRQKLFALQPITQQEVDTFKQRVRDEFKKGGNKRWILILKNELKNAPVDVQTNIVGKQKNLAASVDKLVNIFRFAFSNPQGFAMTMQIPGMAKAFNDIIEFAGLSPIDFSGVDKMASIQNQQQIAPQIPDVQTAPQTVGA